MPVNFLDLPSELDIDTTEATAKENRAGFGELLSRSVELDSTVVATQNILAEAGFKEDPNYNPDTEELEELVEGVPREYWDAFASARSKEHAKYIKANLKRELAEEEFVASHGLKGFGARVTANVADPATVAIGLGTSGISLPASIAFKGGRLARAAKAGLLAATENAAIEAYLATASDVKGVDDVLYAALGGLVLGGTLGGVIGKSDPNITEAAENVATRAEVITAVHQGIPLTPKGEALIAPHPQSPKIDAVVQQDIESAVGVLQRQDGDEIEEGGSVGAAAVGGGAEKPLLPEGARGELDDEFINELASEAPEAAFSWMRWDVTGRLLRSKSPVVRGLGGILAEDGVTHKNLDQVNRQTVTETANLEYRTASTEFYKTFDSNYDKWLEANNYSPTERFFLKARKDFNEQVGRAIRGIEGDYSAEVLAQAGTSRKFFAKRLQLLKDSGVRNAENIDANPNYLPRVVSHEKFKRFIDTYGNEGLVDLVSGSLRSSVGFLDDAKIKAIADGYVKTLRRTQAGINDIQVYLGVNIDESEDLITHILKQARTSDDEIKAIVDDLKFNLEARKKSTDSSVKNLKRRLDLDETHVGTLRNLESGQDEPVGINSIWEDDIEVLLDRYNRSTAGWSALAKIARIKSPADISRLQRIVADESEDSTKELKYINAIIDHTIGRSLEANPDSIESNVGRILRSYNYTRIGGQFGFAQMAEVGNIVGLAGFRETLQVLPELQNIYSRAANGELDNKFFNELEGMIAMGTDWIRNPVATRPDDFGLGGAQSNLEVGLNRAGRFVSAASFMAPVNAVLQRSAAGALAHRVSKMAFKAKNTKADTRMLKSLGIDDEMFERISTQIKAHSELTKGVFGHKFNRINIDGWQDVEASEALRFALHRGTRRIIQENDIGTTLLFTQNNPYGKALVQFRNFALTAVSKQTLRGLHVRDTANALALMWTMAVGGSVYVGQTYLNYFNDEKRLKERLQTDKIAKAALARSGYASMMPAAVDSGLNIAGYDPFFAHTRTSGLQSGINSEDFLGNPTTDLLNKGFRTLRTGKKFLEGEDIKRSDTRATGQALPLYRILGIKHGVDAVSNAVADLDGRKGRDKK